METIKGILIGCLFLCLVGTGIYLVPRYIDTHSGSATCTLLDITDPLVDRIAAKNITAVSGIDDNPWQSADVNVQVIENYQYGTRHLISLPAQFQPSGNPKRRARQIQQFRDSIDHTLNEIYQQPLGKSKSSILFPIGRALKALQGSGTTKKNLIVLSDLQENSSFSIYRDSDETMLFSRPDEVARRFTQIMDIGNVNGITVYLIHQSRNDQDDKLFFAVSNILEQILTEHGAKVIISSNL